MNGETLTEVLCLLETTTSVMRVGDGCKPQTDATRMNGGRCLIFRYVIRTSCVVMIIVHFFVALNQNTKLLVGGNVRQLFPPKGHIAPQACYPAVGVIVQGMHRSGTSLLTSIFIKKGVYDGGPTHELIKPRRHNEKGYFENELFVKQNIRLLVGQGFNEVGTSSNSSMAYNFSESIVQIKRGVVDFSQGEQLLRRWNDAFIPWIVKDPRIAMTYPTWHHFLKTKPAFIFTFRKPLEVMVSLAKQRGSHAIPRVKIEYGMQWARYNEAIVSTIKSLNMCYVITNNDNLLQDPLSESNRIVEALYQKCGVKRPQYPITNLTEIVDVDLRHNRHEETDDSCDMQDNGVKDRYEFLSNRSFAFSDKESLTKLMKVYCDLQSQKVFDDGYEWPKW